MENVPTMGVSNKKRNGSSRLKCMYHQSFS
jgi:hypothetical protein